jgi:hypothetical protein
MPPPPELERYVEEAAKALGIPLEPEWRAAVAEHLSRLLDAWRVIEESELP